MKTEYGLLYADGSMLVRVDDPQVEKIYPTANWAAAQRRSGGRIYRRTITVVNDWVEVTE